MRRKYQDRKHITVYLDASEYEAIEKAAGGPGRMSEWVRERCNEDLECLPARNVGTKAGKQADVPVRGSSEVCPHRKRRGELCYKCDPKFGLPNIG